MPSRIATESTTCSTSTYLAAWSGYPTAVGGHAVGNNLFELTHLPVALAPGDGDDGIWTGSLLTFKA